MSSTASHNRASHSLGAVPISRVVRWSVYISDLLTTFRSLGWVTISRLLVFPVWLRIHGFVDGNGQNAIAEFDIKIQLLDFVCHLRGNVDIVALRLVCLHLQADRIQLFIFSQEFTLRRELEVLFGNIDMAICCHSYISWSLIPVSKGGSLLLNRAPLSINIFRFSTLFSDLILRTAHQGLLSKHTGLLIAHYFWSWVIWAWHSTAIQLFCWIETHEAHVFDIVVLSSDTVFVPKSLWILNQICLLRQWLGFIHAFRVFYVVALV